VPLTEGVTKQSDKHYYTVNHKKTRHFTFDYNFG